MIETFSAKKLITVLISELCFLKHPDGHKIPVFNIEQYKVADAKSVEDAIRQFTLNFVGYKKIQATIKVLND